jgi:hypothetical protein
MSDAVATMGTILSDGAGGRDAVHVAVIAVTASEKLVPGQDVSKHGTTAGSHVGIVDPFLKRPVFPGERYWMFLYPRTITSLRHEWAHPDFPENSVPPTSEAATGVATAVSEAWLRDFVGRSDAPGYEEVLSAAALFVDGHTDGMHFNGEDAHGEIPAEFWTHVEIVLGRKIKDDGPRPAYFSCSC